MHRRFKVSNLQKMADTLAFLQANEIETMEDLQKLQTSSKEHVKETLAKVKMTESRLHINKEMYADISHKIYTCLSFLTE